MDWVRERQRIVYHDTNRGVGAKIVDVPFGVVGVGVVSYVREKEDRVVVVCAEGGTVHFPNKAASCVAD